ncbi:MAG TPA: PIN domain-containing protein [Stellaceae bacterium]|jgi:predicted nucleic acid-binding protein|nr:PIN domain-containing protein [Stellaceae bacterium]
MNVASPRFTLDTNILVYSVDRRWGQKQQLAAHIVDKSIDADCRLTLQSLSEFFSAVSRKGILPAIDAAEYVRDWLVAFSCIAGSTAAVRTALTAATAGRASYWDALLIATSAEAGCRLILTEDLTDGGNLGGVEIHNPFALGGGPTDRARELLDL